jgi:hypothetical protein
LLKKEQDAHKTKKNKERDLTTNFFFIGYFIERNISFFRLNSRLEISEKSNVKMLLK